LLPVFHTPQLRFVAAFWFLAGTALCQEPNQYPRVVLPGDYPDPTILRDGADFYMTHSPFYYTPGFLIWHSKDLIHWEPVARAMTRVVGSAMAPDLVKVRGKYFLYFPAAGANWVMSADKIRGPWSQPVRLNVGGIDPGHAVNREGKRYLFLSGGGRIGLTRDGLSISGTKQQVYSGWDYPQDWKTEGKFLESPKIIRKGAYYYLVSAEGGTAGPATSHMVIAARSKSINGPWENSPHNPIVHTSSAEEPWWSQGHGTLVDDANGNWWLVYHGYKKGCYPLGRSTLIQPIKWLKDGWFRVAKSAPALPSKSKPMDWGKLLSDDFSGKRLGLQWMTWRDYDPKSVRLENQSLYLGAKGAGPQDGRLLLVTAANGGYEIQAELNLGQGSAGGLVFFYSEKAFAGVSSDGLQFTLYTDARQSFQSPNSFGRHFFLRIRNQNNACSVEASGDGKTWVMLDSAIDVSSMHHNNYKGFLALRPGLMALGKGEVQFKDFKYKPL
jgi:beta-xylosidase